MPHGAPRLGKEWEFDGEGAACAGALSGGGAIRLALQPTAL